MTEYDVVVIGAGHNGLVAVAFLAKAGLKTLVLERTDRVGGCAATAEIAPGFRCPVLAHRAGLDATVVRALDLDRHGLKRVHADARVMAPTADGRALTLWADQDLAAREITTFSQKDAERYPAFLESVGAVTRVLHTVLSAAAPDIDHPAPADLISALKAARQFRALGKADAYRLLRWLPMPVADFASEWFESEPLRATVAADGLLGSFLGPRSAGSTAVLLLLAAQDGHPVASGWTPRGGVGTIGIVLAVAARQAGAELRTGTSVRQIRVDDDGAGGVILADGEEIAARQVVSSLDPRHTLLRLVDPVHLSPEFLRRTERIRMRGTLAKINYAVSAVPDFVALRPLDEARRRAALSGCVRLAPHTDAIEQAFDAAKYGRYSDEPWIELSLPSLADPELAPAGQHVVSAYVQFAPYQLRGTSWDTERDRLGELTTGIVERYAPGFARSVVARHVVTPLDLEREWGLTGGHIFQGELALDQLTIARPLLGWARYRTPLRNLYLCGAGTHPGIGIDGRSGMFAARAVINARRR